MEPIIETINLYKSFRTDAVETVALNDVSLQVRQGEFVSIMGPSGCGKSTLLNIIGLLDTQTTGQLYFQGNDTFLLSEKKRAQLRKQNIGFVFQNFNLIDELTVYENIELPLIYLSKRAKERRLRVEEVMEQMQLTYRRRYFPMQLSGGQQQKVALARAIVAEPSIILADEPTGNLDSVQGNEVMRLLEGLNKAGTTVIIVTHSQRDAEYSQRIIRLFDGQVINEDIRQPRFS